MIRMLRVGLGWNYNKFRISLKLENFGYSSVMAYCGPAEGGFRTWNLTLQLPSLNPNNSEKAFVNSKKQWDLFISCLAKSPKQCHVIGLLLAKLTAACGYSPSHAIERSTSVESTPLSWIRDCLVRSQLIQFMRCNYIQGELLSKQKP
jgi:hypothetical protein